MSRPILKVALVGALLMSSHPAAAQPAATLDPSRKWEITDNSFLVEESFNQERGVVQNIFTWTRSRNGEWVASFTQEWPAPGMTHQLSYTVPFARVGAHRGLNDVLLNYRYQLLEEGAGRPAISPRLSVILPTGSEPDGLGDGVVGLQMNVPVSKQFGDFYLHSNAGWTWLPGVEHVPNLGASGIWRVTSMFNLMLEGLVVVSDSATISPGFRRGWNFGERQLVIGAAVPVTRAGGSTSAALLTYFSYELPFR
jgi:hypothetical protein